MSRPCFKSQRGATLVVCTLLVSAAGPVKAQPNKADESEQVRIAHEAFLRGLAFEIGDDGARDLAAAAAEYQAAVELEHTGAMVRLGYLTQTGSGVPRDDGRTVALYRSAAERGDPGGQYRLGVALLEGIGGAPDPSEARSMLAEAATAGHQESQVMLAILQEAGTGGEKNSFSARRWLGRAQEGPDPDLAREAGDLRDRLDEHLLYSASGISEAIAAAVLVGVGIAVALAAVTPAGGAKPYDFNTYDDREAARLRSQMQCVTDAFAASSTVGGMLEQQVRRGCY